MTPVIKAQYSPTDEKYPVVITGPNWWEKLSNEEALALAEELHMAVAQANINKWLEAA